MEESAAKIVKLLPQDWGKYKAIRLEALQSDPIAFADVYEEAFTYEDSYWKNRLENPGGIWLFAEVDSKIVGMIGAYIKDNNHPNGTAIVVGVYVNKNYRGKGIGKKLMNQLIQEIKQTGFIKKINLWVAETQESARKLYEGVGFQYMGKNKKPIEYKGKVYEELIMEKEILL